MAWFLCWLRSSRQTTTIPLGLWVRRTADSVLFWCWPPGPPARMTSRSMSSGRMTMSTSSGSGRTATVAAEVWIRPWVSVDGTRWTRWPPLSNWRWRKAPSPVIPNEASLKPPSSVGTRSRTLEGPAVGFGVPAVHLEQVAGEERGLVAAGPGADLDDQARAVGAGGLVVEEVAERLADDVLAGPELVELGLGVGPHLEVGLGLDQRGGLGDLAAEVEVLPIRPGQLGQAPALLGQRGVAGGSTARAGSSKAASSSRNRW